MEQALGIKGKMIAKKNYAEKAQMKKTWVILFYFPNLFLIFSSFFAPYMLCVNLFSVFIYDVII